MATSFPLSVSFAGSQSVSCLGAWWRQSPEGGGRGLCYFRSGEQESEAGAAQSLRTLGLGGPLASSCSLAPAIASDFTKPTKDESAAVTLNASWFSWGFWDAGTSLLCPIVSLRP